MEWSAVHIMAKESVPIIISCAVWGPCLARKRMEFQCDNQSLVVAINKSSTKDTLVTYFLCCLWFFTAIFHIDLTATHIAGVNNDAADLLSRNHIKQFLTARPKVSQLPTSVPPSLLSLITLQQLEWTSSSFLNKLQQTLSAIR